MRESSRFVYLLDFFKKTQKTQCDTTHYFKYSTKYEMKHQFNKQHDTNPIGMTSKK